VKASQLSYTICVSRKWWYFVP